MRSWDKVAIVGLSIYLNYYNYNIWKRFLKLRFGKSPTIDTWRFFD